MERRSFVSSLAALALLPALPTGYQQPAGIHGVIESGEVFTCLLPQGAMLLRGHQLINLRSPFPEQLQLFDISLPIDESKYAWLSNETLSERHLQQFIEETYVARA